MILNFLPGISILLETLQLEIHLLWPQRQVEESFAQNVFHLAFELLENPLNFKKNPEAKEAVF